jgi:hypothetical protein
MLSSCLSVYVLAAWGGSQPIGAPGAMPQNVAIAAHAERGKSWMLPEAKREDLLYVAILGGLKVYSYPKGKHVGTIKGFYRPEYECTDKSGDVFVVDGDVYEFAHGGKKALRTFRESDYPAVGCAVDPTTGNLAIRWTTTTSSFLAVYPNGTGTPTTYSNSTYFTFCGYDNAGSLYVDGDHYPGGGVRFYELPKGGSTLEPFSANQSFDFAGQIEWVGKYLTIADLPYNAVYRFTVSGSSGTLEGTTNLAISPCVVALESIWIQGNRVLGSCITASGYEPYGQILYYKYPQGGSEIKDIQVGLDTAPDGMVVSRAPSGAQTRR